MITTAPAIAFVSVVWDWRYMLHHEHLRLACGRRPQRLQFKL